MSSSMVQMAGTPDAIRRAWQRLRDADGTARGELCKQGGQWRVIECDHSSGSRQSQREAGK